MIEIQSQVREWGRSIGVVIPKDAVVSEHLRAGDTVELLLFKKTNALKETFGTLKFKKQTDEILKDIKEESWDE